jgi:hypothetical protein
MNFIQHLFIWIKLFTLKIQNLFRAAQKHLEGRMRPAGRGLKTPALTYIRYLLLYPDKILYNKYTAHQIVKHTFFTTVSHN